MNGFLPASRGSLMMDVVVSAMAVVIPVLVLSIRAVRARSYETHRKMQTALATALLVTVILFEIEVRFIGWRERAEASPFYDTLLFPWLYFHVAIAVTTTVLWIATVAHALRRIGKPAQPGAASGLHRKLGKATFVGTVTTALTGAVFYGLAFVAR